MPGLLGWNNDAMRGLLSDFTTGVSRLPYRSLGAPVDLATGLLRPFGYDVPKPIGGSDWMIEKAAQAGIARKPTGTGAELAGDVVGGLLDPNPGPEAALAMKAAGLLGDPSTGGLLQALTVFHGSPHRINNVDDAHPLGRFDLSKIGTGEGNQAYGYGIYLAETPATARTYMSGKPQFVANHGVQNVLLDGQMIDYPTSTPQGVAIQAFKGGLFGDTLPEQLGTLRKHGFTEAADWLEQNAPRMEISKGHFYTVDLPDEHIANMLDWDAPLSEQPEAVRKFVESKPFPPSADQPIGEWLQPRLREGMAEYWSEDMKKAGIPGIKYFDGGSRTAGEGTRNFVIFDGDTAKILKRE